ncbi:MAG TPA: GEVED domain-containing protein, partial [Phycisphaerae bacterium]|nr:GEVED domain-containing protein [Phycisphaerae bacterium]
MAAPTTRLQAVVGQQAAAHLELKERLDGGGAIDMASIEQGRKLEAMLKLEEGELHAADYRGCADCLTPNVDLGTIGLTVWGYSISGDCGTEGKWYASFNGQAGYLYHFDLCATAPGAGTCNFDADLKVTDASCTILAGVDGPSACSYHPQDFQWTAPADGVYYVVIAPYDSSASHTCGGTASNTFTLEYYAEPDPCVGNYPVNDDCAAVTPVALAAGVPVVFNGDNTCAQPDCASFTVDGGGNAWEAFTVSGSATGWDITLDYCGTTPAFGNAWLNLELTCPCTSFTAAGAFETTSCPDGNVTIKWTGMPDGTYYYPVMRDASSGAEGPYTINVVATPTVATYCAASGGCDEHISNVSVGTINNPSACTNYADYTAIQTDMGIGISYPITVSNGNGYGSDQCLVWVDWNQDLDFDDAGEAFTMSGSPGVGPYTGNITPPVDALQGLTRMRVRINYNAAPPTCGTTTYGEVEDYTINVTPAPEFGACCDGESCSESVTEAACVGGGGVYQGDGSDCAPNPCVGACCTAGACQLLTSNGCELAMGDFHGYGTTCTPNPCPPANDYCDDATYIAALPYADTFDSRLATPDGPATGCNSTSATLMDRDVWYTWTATENCTATFTLVEQTSYDMVMGIWQGMDCLSLAPIDQFFASETFAGCLDDPEPYAGSFVASNGVTYWFQMGDWGTASATGGGITNFTFDCVSATAGACCFADTTCAQLDAAACASAGGNYHGDGTLCIEESCPFECGALCNAPLDTFPVCEHFTGGAPNVWIQETADGDQWRFSQTTTPSTGTGPSGPSPDGGYYAYMEASDTATGEQTILVSPCVDLATLAAPEITFFYHMYGDAAMGTLRLQVSTDGCQNWTTIFEKSGPQNDQATWLFAAVDLTPYQGTPVVLRFVGIDGASYTSDMAIDGICIDAGQDRQGACCYPDLQCVDNEFQSVCVNAGGVFKGAFSDCAEEVCGGACCDGTCTQVFDEAACNLAGGMFLGDGTDCGPPNPCMGACCRADSSCTDLTMDDCVASNGYFAGSGTECGSFACPGPNGEGCITANVIASVPFSTTFDNTTYTPDGPATGCNSVTPLMDNDIWYTYTPPSNCYMIFSVDDAADPYDMVMGIWEGPDCNSIVPIPMFFASELFPGCLDDPEPYTDEIFQAFGGVTYWFQMGDYGAPSATAGGITDFALDCVPTLPTGGCCFA